jgi:hypothetical protein
MVLVPGGPFAVGSNKHHRVVAPVHQVTIRILWKVLKGARIPARRMTAAAISRRRHPEPADTSTCHVALRCVVRVRRHTQETP